mgnify:CR=1 FL=1
MEEEYPKCGEKKKIRRGADQCERRTAARGERVSILTLATLCELRGLVFAPCHLMGSVGSTRPGIRATSSSESTLRLATSLPPPATRSWAAAGAGVAAEAIRSRTKAANMQTMRRMDSFPFVGTIPPYLFEHDKV